ncbi:AMP-binding protein [Varibaculum vaginae]|uniref:AMP-binding protein n=1 Tax=Varibaculum vaginae TaxID=2364797 RepID=UPI001356B825|nr:AMP-binding protein [Varibaculum vaginae]
MRIVPPPSAKAREASEVLAPKTDNSGKEDRLEEEKVAPQIIWLQSEVDADKAAGQNLKDAATLPRPLIFLPVSDNPDNDTLFFSALRTALWPDKFISLPTIDLSAVAKSAKPYFALRILADHQPIFFPARTDQLNLSWARQQAQRLRRLPDQTGFILSTSGSTKPGGRLVGISLAALHASHQATAQRLGGTGIWVSALPRDHIAGFQVIARAYAGGTEPVTIDMTGGFKLSRLREALQSISPTNSPVYLSLVPTQLRRALADPETLAILRVCSAILVGGARISPSLLAAGREQGLSLVTTYGMTETCGGCIYDGIPLPGVKVAVNEDRIWLSTPTLMNGYLEAESDSELREISGTTWLVTNDAGKIVFEDKDAGEATGVTIDSSTPAHLEVLGRLDETIISGGENISLPLVMRAAEEAGFVGIEFCGLPDDEWGQILCAVFSESLLSKSNLTPENLNPIHLGSQLRAALRGTLPPSHLPRAVVLLPYFPMLPSGKLDRLSLQESARVLDSPNRTWRK